MTKDRKGNTVPSGETQDKWLRALYRSVPGRIALKVLTAPIISKACGLFMDSRLSVPLIEPFIRKNNIDMTRFSQVEFASYNEFFTRKIRPEVRPIDTDPEHLISPCDSRLTVYPIGARSIFDIKDSRYRIADLLDNRFLARRYAGGKCLIFRLCVDDYHRYCYIDDGSKAENVFIPGILHTVNPIALERYNIYKRNSREYTVLHTENFGDVVQVEVGAMLVGRICNHQQSGTFTRGSEKGFFQFGGSTIVLLLEPGVAKIDPDILKNSLNGIETKVSMGEKIGVKAES